MSEIWIIQRANVQSESGLQAGKQLETLQSQWNSYSEPAQAWLAILMKRYRKDVTQLALNATRDLNSRLMCAFGGSELMSLSWRTLEVRTGKLFLSGIVFQALSKAVGCARVSLDSLPLFSEYSQSTLWHIPRVVQKKKGVV